MPIYFLCIICTKYINNNGKNVYKYSSQHRLLCRHCIVFLQNELLHKFYTCLHSQAANNFSKFLRCYILFFSVEELKHFLCYFDLASSLICGNKMTTRCNRGFYCRSYCLLNMFRAPLCPSSGAQEYYTVVAACGISCCDFQVTDLVWS